MECSLEGNKVNCSSCIPDLEIFDGSCRCLGSKIFKEEASEECIETPGSDILILEENYFDKKAQKISLKFDEELAEIDYMDVFEL